MLFENRTSFLARLVLILTLLVGTFGVRDVQAAPLGAGGTTTVLVTSPGGIPLAGKPVYAFNGSTYTGYSQVTDANGEAALALPEGTYRFRVDVDGTKFWSGSENHCSNCLNVAMTIPDPVSITVLDTDGAPATGLNVYAFSGATYTGFHGITDQAGQVSLRLLEGSYRFRADLNGTQFWSETANHCDVPGCAGASVTVSQPTTVTVLDTDGLPKGALSVYAFDGSTYTGYNKTTNADGQAVFTLPLGSYRFRADLNGTQFWSGTANHCDIPGCSRADVTVSKPMRVTVLDTDEAPKAGLNVYAFNGSTYTGYSKTTSTDGQAVFTLPLGSYRFRADLNGTQFWSGTANHCTLPGCESAQVTVTIPIPISIQDGGGAPKSGVNVYAFNGSSYTGYSKVSDANGQAIFTLPAGSYRFRADYSGVQYWSGLTNHCTLPGCSGAAVTVGPAMTATFTPTPFPTNTPTPTSLPARFLRVVQPNGGEELTVGTTYRITWDSTSDIDMVTIGYKSCDSCLDWIAYDIPNLGYYDWNVFVGNTTNTQFKIEIIGYDTGVGSTSDVSDNYFTVLKPPATNTPIPTYTPSQPPVPRTRVVTNANDSGDGSLRQTILEANPGDAITFAPALAGQTITLTSNLTILKDLIIDGSGLSSQVTISGGNVAHLEIKGLPNVIIFGLTIANGYTNGNGGAISSTGDLTIINSTLRNNHADGDGGAVFISSSGTLTLENTTVDHNQAGSDGGAFAFEGNAQVDIVNSTVAHNQAGDKGGAFLMTGTLRVALYNSTIAMNSAPGAGGAWVDGSTSLHLYNTIFVCEPQSNDCIYLRALAEIYYMNSPIDSGPLSEYGLTELADNGGPTQTMALLSDSQLIDAGDDSVCVSIHGVNRDQRGVPRPQGAHCDIGAYEYELEETIIPTTTTLVTSPNPSEPGQAVTAVATVEGSSGTPTGTVNFSVDGNVLCTRPLSNGTASCDLILNENKTVVAMYIPDNPDYLSSLGMVLHYVSTSSTIVTILDSPDPSIQGNSVNILVSVTNAYGGSTPTGTVTVSTGSGGCVLTLDNGQASCIVIFNNPGMATLTAQYSGDAQHLPSGSTATHEVLANVPTPTYTPTVTPPPGPTPVLGCSSLGSSAGTITISGKTMYLTIRNTNPYPVTIRSVFVSWNYSAGHTVGDTSLWLQKADLNGAIFWTGNLNQPAALLSPSTTVVLPANSTTKLTFTFDKIYDRRSGNEQIQVQFSTPGCENYPVIRPAGMPTITPVP